MPPLRPLPDLCLITLFKMMPPNEQMVASQMSPRCAGLVRAANRTVNHAPLIAIPGGPSFPDYPLTTRLSKWHCLVVDLKVQIDTATIEQIVNNFSAVTDLKYITRNRHYLVPLLPLLQHPQWQCQLTHFMAHTTMWLDGQPSHELIAAINGLTALKCLALEWYTRTGLPDLTILAQLKVVVFESDDLQAFVRSLEQYAADNADLQVHLFSSDTNALLSLSQPLHSRIVRYGPGYLDYTGERVPLFCSQFRSLTSLSTWNITVTQIVPLFTALSQLHQLIHLRLGVSLRSGEELPPPLARPLAQLNSLRALELRLRISSHSQVQWLNLPVRMPNLQTIYIKELYCDSCKVEIDRYIIRNSLPLNSSKAINCLQSSLFTLHSGVPLNRLILELKGECISAEILLQSASEPSISTGSVASVFPKSLSQSDHHPKTMPPLLQISDLSWITIFQEFTPNEQMVASKMSPRYAVLVRAANLKVKSLVITDRNDEDPCDLKFLKNQINRFCLASTPAIQQLMNIPGEPSFPDYPLTVSAHLSKWHCLVVDSREQIDTATTEQIVYIFSAYITHHNERLVPLLQHPQWQCQLTNFMVDWIKNQKGCELITAINGLTALQHLALYRYSDAHIYDLPILAQLKVVALQSFNLRPFLRSLERYATDNADLQVYLLSCDTDALLSLSQPLHSRIVRFGWSYLDYTRDRVPLLCSQFLSLTSIFINGIVMTDVVPLFTSLSQLHQLVHLGLGVYLWSGEELPLQARPLAQLNSLRALELRLNIDSHSQVQWLNLPVTMPNLQTIFIEWFSCGSCGVKIYRYIIRNSSPLNSSKAINCLPSSLFTLHSGVPLNRLILDTNKECISAEKLLFQSASEQC
ncbi:hypothetical protein TYRP_005879, partial [Tyrophagus putrescentiae]